jgi:hypothetical protein
MGRFHVYEIYTGLQLLETPGCRRERERERLVRQNPGEVVERRKLCCV